MQYNKIASVSYMHMTSVSYMQMTSVSYPRNKQKQAIALLPTLSGKHKVTTCLYTNPYRSYYKNIPL